MQVGDIVKIENNAGILEIHVKKELSLSDVSRGFEPDRLPSFKRPRLEFHKASDTKILVTICEIQNGFPLSFYMLYYSAYDSFGNPKVFYGEAYKEETEEFIFKTINE